MEGLCRMKTVITLLSVLLFVHHECIAQRNHKPKITGQATLTINEDQKITILMTYLAVEDRDDWFYPWGFTMRIHPGDNYTFQGHEVTPAANFFGTLLVRVTVNDGKDESHMYNLVITVNPVNDKPVITGHSQLEVDEGQSLTILPQHLQVADPDDNYPSDFTLQVYSGTNYTASGTQITPSPGFSGNLTVIVGVHDGALNSDLYQLPVVVKPVARVPEIVGQAPLQVVEDGVISIEFSHLNVVDEDSDYPNGFKMNFGPGKNYIVSGNEVRPGENFSGTLTIPTTVSDGSNTSKPFNLVITVTPIEDPPLVVNIETEPLTYNAVAGVQAVSQTLTVHEVDGDSIISAVVGIRPESYQVELDQLTYTDVSGGRIKASFDARTGILTLTGRATPERYTEALRNVRYECLVPASGRDKTVFFSVNDGKSASEEVTRSIQFGKVSISLDIPTGFTPNGDLANDTWKIIPIKEEEAYANARIRVYNKDGVMVFESIGFDNEWDGTYDGVPLPAETYFYTIDLNIRAPEGFLKGVVTILR
jgi:gliding motility-associated-like protein